MNLEQRWFLLHGNVSKAKAGELRRQFDAIITAYGSSLRGYHGLDHLTDCLTEFDTVKAQLSDPLAVEKALWYHDIEYNVNPRYVELNEIISASRAREDLKKIGASVQLASKIVRHIMATRHIHRPDDWDGEFVADIDLAGFGHSPEKVLASDDGIWKEYGPWITDWDAARAKRVSILQMFLGRRPLYYTKHFRDKYEEKARQNIGLLIAKNSRAA